MKMSSRLAASFVVVVLVIPTQGLAKEPTGPTTAQTVNQTGKTVNQTGKTVNQTGKTVNQTGKTCPNQVARATRVWTKIALPEHRYKPSLAIDPTKPDQLFLRHAVGGSFRENQQVTRPPSYDWVKRSRDGGCSWETIFELPDVSDMARPQPLITQDTFTIADMAAGPGRLYLLLLPRDEPVSSMLLPPLFPYLAVSRDSGESWEYRALPAGALADFGNVYGDVFPDLGDMQVSQVDPDVVYLLMVRDNHIPQYVNKGSMLFHTVDGGATWQQSQSDLISMGCALAIDPVDPDVVWVWGRFTVCNPGLMRSRNRGDVWEIMDLPLGGRRLLDFALFNRGGVQRYIFMSSEAAATFATAESRDGVTWAEPEWGLYGGPVNHLVFGTNPNQMMGMGLDSSGGSSVGIGNSILRYEKRVRRWVDVTPPGATPESGWWGDPVMVESSGRAVFYWFGNVTSSDGGDNLWRYSG